MGQIYGIKYIPENRIVYIGQTIRDYKQRWQQHKQQSKERKYAIYNAFNKYGINNFLPVLIEDNIDDDLLNEREVFWIKQYNTFIENDGYNLTLGGDNVASYQKVKVYQYSLDGEFINEYNSITEAGLALNIESSLITRAINGQLKSTHNFLWSTNKYDKFPTPYKQRHTAVAQYDLNDNFIQEFPTLRAAALFCKSESGSRNIQLAAQGKRKTAYGYKWKLTDS